MAKRDQHQLTKEQAEKAINMCLENARSFLDDADMYISNKKMDHLAIPIEFAMEEIGKVKIIFDKLDNNKQIVCTNKDGIYDHKVKLKVCISLLDLDPSEKILQGRVWGDDILDYAVDPFAKIMMDNGVKKLQETASQGHNERISSSFVYFDDNTGEPMLTTTTQELSSLRTRILGIIKNYPKSFSGS